MNILTRYDHGIYAIDAHYGAPLIAAVHLIVENGRVALVDTGHNPAVPQVLAQMAGLGLHREQVDYIILTHVHLDHAGAAGTLMQHFPNAQLVVHPRGARHMIDPSKLAAATREVYGEEKTLELYGELVPVAAERVIEAGHEKAVSLAGRQLQLFDAPGHAKHHITIRDERTGHFFTGDTFGLSYRHLDANGRAFVFPTTTPSQFDPAALHATVDLIAGYQPEALYFTHYSQARDVPRLAGDMHRLLDELVAIAQREKDSGPERQTRICAGILDLVEREAAEQGWALQGKAAREHMTMDAVLNAQGLDIWLG
ncbi:MAG TPA: MBL fold metallo-hydrolase [Rhodocyclaceae bacterium]